MTRHGIMIGYARTSTLDQSAGLEAQLRDLKAAGCKKLYQEQVSSVAERVQLEAALDYAREGDTLVVTKLDRLARSSRHLTQIVDALEAKGVALRILNLGGETVDTRGATGRLILNVFAAFAQFEREMMLERQREGIEKAKAKGLYKGRKPTARAKAADAVRLFQQGQRVSEIATTLGISRGSVYRALEAAGLHSPSRVSETSALSSPP
jgi:DNA invertase Pin-like site-specific DNA recombinase